GHAGTALQVQGRTRLEGAAEHHDRWTRNSNWSGVSVYGAVFGGGGESVHQICCHGRGISVCFWVLRHLHRLRKNKSQEACAGAAAHERTLPANAKRDG